MLRHNQLLLPHKLRAPSLLTDPPALPLRWVEEVGARGEGRSGARLVGIEINLRKNGKLFCKCLGCYSRGSGLQWNSSIWKPFNSCKFILVFVFLFW